MILSVEAASLFAQVLPALLIALLVEGRFAKRENRSKRTLRALMILRLAAVLLAAAATFMCMLVVVVGASNPFVDGWLTVTLAVVFAAFLVMCGEVFDREILEHS